MADPLNPSFEAGANGTATNWTVDLSFGGDLIADFGEPGGTPKPVEDFDSTSWGTDPYVRTVDTGLDASFDTGVAPQPTPVEAFQRWNGNGLYAHTVVGGLAATFDGGAATVEDFVDASWGVAGYATEVSIAAGNMGPSFGEDFSDSSWNGGSSYATTVSSGTAATFYNGGSTVESFESVALDLLFIPDPSTSTCTTPTPHGKSNGYKVTITSSGRLAGGFVANQTYYFVNVTSTTFQLATTIGGTPIHLSDVGSGSQFAHADESAFWTLS